MRQIYGRLLLLVTTALLIMAGCTPEGGKDKEFDESFLYGKWYCSQIGLFYEFNGSHTGKYYDSNDDGKSFEWTLDKNALQIKALGENVHVIAYETYIITSLNTSTMVCYDEQDPGETLTFRIQ